MPEVKNTFLKSKMNKDLDARILPNGEYRDAQNVNVSKSEGEDVGSLENVLSNIQISDIKSDIVQAEILNFSGIGTAPTESQIEKALDALEIIGRFMDVKNDRMFLMLTNYNDTSPDRISNFAFQDGISFAGNFIYKGACCYICEYNVSTSTNTVLVAGNFLNFSKTHKILSINILENLLFWTDDRNQPRKINIQRAINESYSSGDPYYYSEDQISVAKFAPVLPISLVEEVGSDIWQSTMESVTQEYLPIHLVDSINQAKVIGNIGVELRRTFSFGASDSMINVGDKVIIEDHDGNEYDHEIISIAAGNQFNVTPAFTVDIEVGWKVKLQRQNPFYDTSYVGDENTLKDKFVRFSYRFKYDDNEYSLFAPFTQEVFIPKQFGYFVDDDQDKTGRSGIVSFMENLVDKVKFNIRLPYLTDSIEDILKVKEIQIVSKASDELAVKVIEDIVVSDITAITQDYIYEYNSIKPYKTLPENELTRVHDKVPVRAKCQEVTSNRVMYGNFIDKHTSPDFLNYENAINIKGNLNPPNDGSAFTGIFNQIRIEYPNHTLKQNRNYTIGVVLMDRYGRPSNVILSDKASSFKASTIYSPYRNFGVGTVQDWPGDILDIIFNEPIPNSGPDGYPGLYSQTNPLGWYSYKIVVKQQEQEYYNVYVAGILAGEMSWNTSESPSATPAPSQDETAQNQPTYINANNTSLISLFGDNINKIPRNLSEVGPTDIDFGSSVRLFNRVNPNSWISNIFDSASSGTEFTQGISYNIQSNVNSTPDTIDFIKPFKQFGEWTTEKGNLYPGQQFNQDALPFKDPWYPFTGVINTANEASGLQFRDPLFKANENPFVASISTQLKTGVQPVKYIDSSEPPDPPNDYEFYRNTGSTRLGDTTLGVYETNPVESLLELFWETSTAGLIKNDNYIITSDQYQGLNDLIEDGIGNPAPAALSDTNFVLNEADLSGTNALSNEFELLDSTGTPCADTSNTITILSVKDGYGNERKKGFDINNTTTSGLDKWMITSNNNFVYNQDANVRESYTFYLECQAWGYTTTLSFKGRLVNTPPQNISFPIVPSTTFSTVRGIPETGGDVVIVNNGDFVNGCGDSNKELQELVYEISFIDTTTGDDFSDHFSWSFTVGDLSVIYDGNIDPSDYPDPLNNIFSFPLAIKDANGNGDSLNLTLVIQLT